MPNDRRDVQLPLFANNGFTELAISRTVTVTAVGPALALGATAVNGGTMVTMTAANGLGAATDWVGLYSTIATDMTFIDWWYLNGTKTAPVQGARQWVHKAGNESDGDGGSAEMTASVVAGFHPVDYPACVSWSESWHGPSPHRFECESTNGRLRHSRAIAPDTACQVYVGCIVTVQEPVAE